MNLDCRIERSNLFEAICTLLSKAAFPVGSTLGSVHLLSLEGIHSILAALASRSALIIMHCISESLPCCHHHSSALVLKEMNKQYTGRPGMHRAPELGTMRCQCLALG